MKDKQIKAIENDMKTSSSYFYFSDKMTASDFSGSNVKLLLVLIPSICSIIDKSNLSMKEFTKWLMLFDKTKNEDE